MKILKIIFLCFIISTLNAKELEKVSVQLQWLDQFQFAGYYIAKEKGFYNEVGLDVEIKKFDHGISTVTEVTSGKATYGIGRSSLVIDKANGVKINLLASIFQSSPSVFVARKDSNINNIKDFKGKKIMVTSDVASGISLYALENKYKLSKHDFIIQEHSFDINDLINKKTDLMSSYISNEPYLLEKKGIEYKIFDPKDHGFDIYSDILFTSTKEITNNKQRAINFKKATIKGWRYAFNNINETINLILKKYNTQNKTKEAYLYEANKLKKLAYYNTKFIGKIEKPKIQRIYDIYNILGLIDTKININEFVFDSDTKSEKTLTNAQKKYLKHKEEIKVCTPDDFAPFIFKKNDVYEGILVDYLNKISKSEGFKYKIMKASTVEEHFKMLQNSECDVLSLIATNSELHKNLIPTKSIIEDDVVLVTKINRPYIYDLNNVGRKKIAIRKGQKTLKKYVEYVYPNINLIEIDKGGLEGVNSGKYYGYISVSYFVGHKISTNYFYNLKIMSKIGKGKIKGSFGVSVREPILVDILNNGIDKITKKEKKSAIEKWVYINYTQALDYAFVRRLVIGFVIVLIIVIIFLIKQNKLKGKIQDLNRSLEQKVDVATKELKTAQKLAKIGSWRFERYSGKLTWSDETYEIFGRDKELDPVEVESDFYKHVYNEDVDIVKQAYETHKTTQEKYIVTHRILTKDNKIKYVEERCESVFDSSGELLISVGTVQDITEQRVQNQYIIRQSRLAQMGEMISMIAHQWRQPLGAISAISIDMKMQLELDTYDFSNKSDKELFIAYFIKSFDNIDSLIQGLTRTINDFKDFYKPNKKLQLESINYPISSALSIIKNSLSLNNIIIEESLLYKNEIEMYSNELVQVFLNIFKNAQDNFLDKKINNAKILINTSSEEDDVLIEISDNGGGIDDNIIENIFDPYFSTKDEKNGTGLGLYMSKLIIEEHHHGKISVENQYDTSGNKIGAIFCIKLKAKIVG